jgi:ankyrin repeat protein
MSDDDWFERERLHRAADSGDLSQMQQHLASGCPLNTYDDISFTPLHYAARSEHYRAAALLLDAGADVNAHEQEKAGETPLCVAVKGEYPEMVELLLQRGADPDIPGWMGVTARVRAHQRTDEDGRTIFAIIERLCPSKASRTTPQ